jgi:hypothetical protein
MTSAKPLLIATIAQAFCDIASPPRPRSGRAQEPLEANPPGMEWLEDEHGGGWACTQVGLDHGYIMEAARRAQKIGRPVQIDAVMKLIGGLCAV